MLLLGLMFRGMPWGVFSTLVEAYASEICPRTLRAHLTGWINVCWVMGRLAPLTLHMRAAQGHRLRASLIFRAYLAGGFVASGVTVATQGIQSTWDSYSLRHAMNLATALITLMYFAPESPWWPVRHGRLQEAETSVRRLGAKHRRDLAPQAVANMVGSALFRKCSDLICKDTNKSNGAGV